MTVTGFTCRPDLRTALLGTGNTDRFQANYEVAAETAFPAEAHADAMRLLAVTASVPAYGK
ncbi:MAG: hypothetical protein J2P58_01320 [Acidimicrobiaceae bacterium]|nr:hypothetical protein [Acidimicrobiaceae bacterium]